MSHRPSTQDQATGFVFAAFVLMLTSTSIGGCGLTSRLGCAGSGGYDTESLLTSIRPEHREALAGQAGLGALDELPLYTIDVQLDLGLLTFQGSEQLLFRNRTGQPLSEVVLRLYPNARQLNVQGSQNLSIDEVRVDDQPVTAQHQTATTVRVPLTEALGPGESMTLSVSFRGSIPRYRDADADPLLQGLGQVFEVLGGGGGARGADYGVFGAGSGIVSMGLWYPRLADWTQQGWDASDPAEVGDISTVDLANYRVSITTERDVTVVTTGVVEEQEEHESRVRRTFVAAAVRSFAWQASRSYASQERQMGDVVVRSTFDRAHGAQGNRVGEIATAALTFYERRFGPYPYAELDVVEAPLRGGAGGVEWPGLVTVGRALYQDSGSLGGLLGQLMPSGGPSQEYWQETFEFVIAHEVAHQYWNAVVGSDSRSHPFIDESMAQFSAAAYFGDRYGTAREQQVLERQVRLNYHFHRLAGGQDGPVDRPAQRFGNALEYTGIVYGKGPFYFVELRRELGDGAFWQGMQRYYERFRFRVAAPQDLPSIMAEVSANQPVVDRLTQRWLREAHGDEDLGNATFASVMEPIFGPDAANLTQQLESILGGLGGSGSGGGSGQGADPGRILNDMLEGLGGSDGIRGLLQDLFPDSGTGGQQQNPQPSPRRPAIPNNQPPRLQPQGPNPGQIQKGRPTPPQPQSGVI